MVLSYLALAVALKPVDFPEAAIPREIDTGVRTYALGRGLDRLYLDDRKVVGVWFDGRMHRDADQVLWISPSLASRWLGYLEAKEKWPSGELEKRWVLLRKSLGGRMTFIVRLCAMPKIDIFDQEVASPADPCDMKDVRFLWTAGKISLPDAPEKLMVRIPGAEIHAPEFGKRTPTGLNADPAVYMISERRSDVAGKVLQEDWWMQVPFFEPLQPEFGKECLDEMMFCGDFHCRTYLVSLYVPTEPIENDRFELRIFSPRKERVARFSLVGRR